MIATDHLCRWMICRDVPRVLDIDWDCFLESWDKDKLVSVLRNRNTIGIVVENEGGYVVGFVVYALHKAHIEILRLGVDGKYRRRGFASVILNRLKDKVAEQQRESLGIDVAGTSIHAQKCLQAHGFIASPLPDDVIRFIYSREVGND